MYFSPFRIPSNTSSVNRSTINLGEVDNVGGEIIQNSKAEITCLLQLYRKFINNNLNIDMMSLT
jgi:hypothetical protein